MKVPFFRLAAGLLAGGFAVAMVLGEYGVAAVCITCLVGVAVMWVW